jgi:uncharacterized protein YggU (UPF0235/DUF167 family)
MARERAGLPSSELRGLDLAAVAGGTRLRLRVKPGARRRAVLGVLDGALKLSVTTVPERGKANRSVLRLLAEVLAVPAGEITLLAGAGSRDKTVLVPLPPAEVATRLGDSD